jgi:hypothetical protein
MRLVRVTTIAAVLVLGLASPPASRADHCGGAATVEPASGPIGTTFVFRTSLGATTNLYLYRGGTLVRTDTLAGDGSVTYRVRTGPGDAGRWRIRAAVQGGETCYGEARFRVTAIPDTSTAPAQPAGAPWPLAGLAALAGVLLGLFRTGRRSSSRAPRDTGHGRPAC